jgi:hypothetical protein
MTSPTLPTTSVRFQVWMPHRIQSMQTDGRTTSVSAAEFRFFQAFEILMRHNPSVIRKSKVSFETVRQIGVELPGVQESTAYGMPALKIDGKLVAAIPANRTVEPDSLVVRMSFEDREALLAAAPEVYYLTDHYLDYDAVLVRLSHVTSEVLKDLLRTARKYVIRNSPQSRGNRAARSNDNRHTERAKR